MTDIRLYQGDCLDILPQLEDGCVDAVITDPPYNVGKDYGTYKDDLPHDEYVDMMRMVIDECMRISDGNIAFYVGSKLLRTYAELIPDSHLIVVHKRAVGIICNNYFLQYHCLFSTMRPLSKTKDLWDDVRLPGEGYFYREERFGHPGETSCVLTKKIINTFVKEGGVILDPFMGTGTTGVGAVQTNRRFVGIEMDDNWYRFAENRIKDSARQAVMEL